MLLSLLGESDTLDGALLKLKLPREAFIAEARSALADDDYAIQESFFAKGILARAEAIDRGTPEHTVTANAIARALLEARPPSLIRILGAFSCTIDEMAAALDADLD
jgi:hypothetical protein